ncbi:MAG TPA: phosphoglycerate dehydrogenase [Candidatus Sulfotelmatobacter sp.]|nr:phosphoglycerate dehydrogenase [Candidatus Sulfotelmatobacter sp.]
MKVLLLENISGVAVEQFRDAGYEVEALTAALEERELVKKLTQEKVRGASVSILGVRSKTRVSAAVIAAACETASPVGIESKSPPSGTNREKGGAPAAPKLVAVGAFCIGVDKIDRAAASERGVAVFNDPHSNSRSVAELAMGEIIVLLRRVFFSSTQMHLGVWNKSAAGAHEVRGLTLGIVGYGKIGSQVSDLAEALGMRVVFYDVSHVLARGNARAVGFGELLEISDVVTLHVDGKPQNQNLFGAEEFRRMKDGACFLNLSRGFVVDHEALAAGLKTGKIAGAAVDVFPKEPESGAEFRSVLQGLPNVILTPHVGGSTEEAQQNIGQFVSARLVDYVKTGNSLLSVNLPHCHLEYEPGGHRLMHIHRNVPGILRAINDILADRGINIERQVLDTRGTLGYAIYDINRACDEELMRQLRAVPHTIGVRMAE